MPNPPQLAKEAGPQKTPPGGADTPDRAGNATGSRITELDFTEAAQAARAFLCGAVPEVQGGRYALWTKHDKRHHWFDSHEALVAAQFGKFRDTPDTYYATAVFGDATSPKTGDIARSQANVVGRLCLHADLDCGAEKYAKKPDETYPTQRDALAAVVEAVKSKAIPQPNYALDSGTGFHLYWCFDRVIDRHQWEGLAGALARAAKAAGLKFDPACTTDSARLLRLPGSLHNCGARVRMMGGKK